MGDRPVNRHSAMTVCQACWLWTAAAGRSRSARPQGRERDRPSCSSTSASSFRRATEAARKCLGLGNAVGDPAKRGLFIGTERGKQATFHWHLRLGSDIKDLPSGAGNVRSVKFVWLALQAECSRESPVASSRRRRRAAVLRGAQRPLYEVVGNPETQPRNVRRNDADAEKALAQCRHGDWAASIPVLERKLADNRITLPQRPIMSRSCPGST